MDITGREKIVLEKAGLPDHPQKILGKVFEFVPRGGEPGYGTITGMQFPPPAGGPLLVRVQGLPRSGTQTLRQEDDGFWTLIIDGVEQYKGTLTI